MKDDDLAQMVQANNIQDLQAKADNQTAYTFQWEKRPSNRTGKGGNDFPKRIQEEKYM